ncbi:hypothetical protein ACFY1B_47345 [Streptomyces mirabilis]|uniref:hypothetical protein n=1 Tax=Streptomyces mirabilis TaxID=68239 RepID=UPI0036C984FE
MTTSSTPCSKSRVAAECRRSWLRYQRYARDIANTLVTRRKRGLSPQLVELADFLSVEL